MKLIQNTQFLLLLLALFLPIFTEAQISSDADASVSTEYSSGAQDQIYIFCVAPDEKSGELTATSSTGTATFEWLKYNPGNGSFDGFQTDNSGGSTSTIMNLADGGYRVNITSGAVTETYTAWVMNSWYTATAEISESTCDYFQLTASIDEEAELNYYDLSNGAEKPVVKDVKAKWTVDGGQVAAVLSPQIFSPPSENKDYTLTVYDRFGCQVEVTVNYQSIVPEASFTYVANTDDSRDTEGAYEAPAEIAFTNTSMNADQYEWFLYRSQEELVVEGENGTVEDSIMQTAIDQNPTYVYESSGNYNVKLVTTKNGDGIACRDTFYIEEYIEVSTSWLTVPNVFTPNGDQINDDFIVGYESVRSINVQIFNRWGKKVHTWENNNIQGFNDTRSESAWDGKIGGRYASPGVYYYVVEAVGRDDQEHFAHGFVHLFRGK
ncbi:gliding motility-associated C-terminal domain-containing protein [uncultured Sunxiuqinia sp.]|uniref:T9SS type B sorting domain-containing protein n=1 Tax=uncultured Sunxiuqinia sp. TaxID=1573825 RepID=UPI002AA8C854|nr:gliding motility-associated C-terminal domain-containing protein [uncultured Sunxiuqinia sp.]